jgi:hypothetical protein
VSAVRRAGGNVSAVRRVGESAWGLRPEIVLDLPFNVQCSDRARARSRYRSRSSVQHSALTGATTTAPPTERQTPNAKRLGVYLSFLREFFQDIPPQKPIAQHLGGYSHRLELTGIT